MKLCIFKNHGHLSFIINEKAMAIHWSTFINEKITFSVLSVNEQSVMDYCL